MGTAILEPIFYWALLEEQDLKALSSDHLNVLPLNVWFPVFESGEIKIPSPCGEFILYLLRMGSKQFTTCWAFISSPPS